MGIIAALLSIVLGLVQIVLGLRIVAGFFSLTSANGPAIIDSLYRWSDPWVAPFTGWLPSYEFGGFVLEVPAVIAVIAYGVLGSLIIRALSGRRRA